MFRTTPPGNCHKHTVKTVCTLLLLASLAIMVGCAGFSSAPPHATTPGSNLQLQTAALNFGSIAAGSSKTLTVSVSNAGPESVTVSGIAFSNHSFSLASPGLPATIAAGKSLAINVKFAPTAAGTFKSTVTITSDPSNAMNLSLTGIATETVTPGVLGANPASKNFNSVTVGSQLQQTITLSNQGGSTVNISQASISGAGFQLSGISTPLTLNPTDSTTFTVTFAPQAAGSASGNVAISSDASNPNLTIGLSGTGTAAVGQLSATQTVPVGNVVVGTTGNAQGSLTASGASVTVSAASSNNSAFSISGLSLPVTIPAGQSVPFTVTFDPSATGSASATLTFTSNAQPSATTDTATGNGTAPPTYTVKLNWNPPSDTSNISGYNIYRAVYTNSCGSFAKINTSLNSTTTYTDTVVLDGSSYCYATTTVNSSNKESGYSNIISNFQIPAP